MAHDFARERPERHEGHERADGRAELTGARGDRGLSGGAQQGQVQAQGEGGGDGQIPEPTPVLEGFRQQVRRAPSATALVVGGLELTYRELDLACAALARRLRGHGAGPGRVVCVRLEQNAVAVTALLAALRTGAAWAVVEPDQPPARLRALLADTDCAVVLGSGPEPALEDAPGAPALLDVTGLDVRELAAEGERLPGGPDPAEAAVSEDAPAYIVCTSGSTGAPKGVVVSRRQLATSIAPREWVYGSGPATYLMAMRLSFDGMLGGMFWSFTRGHTLLLPDDKQLRQVHELARLAGEFEATHLIVVPSYYRALLEESRLLPPSLRLVVVAGEPCTQDLVRLHHERLPGASLVNEYGPTETTISCTVQPWLAPSRQRIPIGRPWAGAVAHVLDERLREVPAGERGELYIGGGFVALGYAGQPGRTAERFVADPYGPPGARLYRTGDIAHVDEEGALHCHGRTDHQVKIRGTRVELGETEGVLEAHPGVGQAVAVCDVSGTEHRLVAFLTPAEPGGATPSWAELREHCAEHLVEQAVPVLFHTLERMPLGSSGKADRTALTARVPEAAAAAASHTAHTAHADPGPDVPPGGPHGDSGSPADPGDTAHTVSLIWADVLGHGASGPHDNFFAVGGSSLRVIDLHKRLERQWPGVLRVGELFDLTTVSAQAEAIAARLGVSASGDESAPAAYEL
ncbi:amino acid adenylation domain-containing protein [Streptomyces sp. Amel2xB2]|uniref:non-ribosomal peptide synthetase n=1 Tax=Streptomyces sp. Amel2xB2 TaxID=1305829 RepID=UPI000DBA9E7B|nr:non-ribosomal peptide synthetase [Streptomyces sp. Amel2xB2]RAJ68858.1 amino acid adenylation domain-containing protein [Streptomyces sp. Amel2xB2]